MGGVPGRPGWSDYPPVVEEATVFAPTGCCSTWNSVPGWIVARAAVQERQFLRFVPIAILNPLGVAVLWRRIELLPDCCGLSIDDHIHVRRG